MKPFLLSALAILVPAALPVLAQAPNHYSGTNATGQLTLTATVNLSRLAATQTATLLEEAYRNDERLPPGAVSRELRHAGLAEKALLALGPDPLSLAAAPGMQSLPISPASNVFGFNGLTHTDQRMANHGNQFNTEPPSPSVAVANGFVLEGVNNAVQVYSTSGAPVLPLVLASNQVFGLAPALNRATGVNGVFPTDMRVFYDQSINRWFILQRAQDNDSQGNNLTTSHLYIAVSQTSDPTQTYNVYTMNTTNSGNFGCPCVADYPQVGADEYGFFVSANEYDSFFSEFVDAEILAISKASLAAGVAQPTVSRFLIPFGSGYEFTIQPATTPPGASYFLAGGGVEYFVSSQRQSLPDSNLAIWAMSNTSSLGTGNPNLALTQIIVPTLSYSTPNVANQRPGPIPYGASLGQPLAYLDGSDSRILSVSYAGANLYTTMATTVSDENGRTLVGGAFVILSPTLRGGALAATVQRQGYLLVKNNSLLRPALAVNAQGKGAIAFTLAGPDYFPSAAFLPIDTFSTGSAIQVTAPGAAPEDGFSGYNGDGVARWGDYSTAVAAGDGSIWMGTEYIPALLSTPLVKANWGTFIMKYTP